MQNESRENKNKPDELWIRHFLIDHTKNKRGWSISKETSQANVLSAIGAPLVLKQDEFSHADHPEFNVHESASINSLEQSKYKIGTIERIWYSKEKDAYFCDSKITDKDAKNSIRCFTDKNIPLEFSPQIVFDSRTEPSDGPYKQWIMLHSDCFKTGLQRGSNDFLLQR